MEAVSQRAGTPAASASPADPAAPGAQARTTSETGRPESARRDPAATPRATGSVAGGPRARAQTLLQIDAITELLDATGALPTPEQRSRSALQSRLEAAGPLAGARADPDAPKVVFPTYDPTQHGEDVRSTARRRPPAPVEGHFPAPRQPLRTNYRHPDGKPMTAEECKVEEVLQAQRCDQTLSVLARDGVNGLLLSPRDLDAAVASGVLDAETAATLWKTWAALRPVIHVIEDEATDTANDRGSADIGLAGDPDATAPLPQSPAQARAASAEASPIQPPVPAVRPPLAADPGDADTLPLGRRVQALPADPQQAAPLRGSPASRLGAARRGPAAWLLRGFVAYAVLSTTLQLGEAAWRTGWGWDLLRWVRQLGA